MAPASTATATTYDMSYAVFFTCNEGAIPPAEVHEFGTRITRVNGDSAMRFQLRKQLAKDADREIDFEDEIPPNTYRVLVPWTRSSAEPNLGTIKGIEVITMTAFPT